MSSSLHLLPVGYIKLGSILTESKHWDSKHGILSNVQCQVEQRIMSIFLIQDEDKIKI